MGYFWATRPAMGVLGFVLTLVGFRIQPHLNIPFLFDYLCALNVFVTISATMVTNDYVDRHHDLKKGKRFALDYEVLFLRYCFAWWLLTVVLITLVSSFSLGAGLYATAIAAVGAGYHLTYGTRGLALLAVAGMSAATMGFTLFLPGAHVLKVFEGAWIIFCLIAAREHCKDEEDRLLDAGYKETIALVSDEPTGPYEGVWGSVKHFFAQQSFYWAAFPFGGYFFDPTPLTVVAITLLVINSFFLHHYRRLVDPAMGLILISGLTNFSI